ncbi:MAG: ABC transporter substrate-binding protein, partial [Rhizobiaceae bacterium]
MPFAKLAAAATLSVFLPSIAAADTTLRVSHQFPGGKGDVRDEMVQLMAREVKAADVGLELQ